MNRKFEGYQVDRGRCKVCGLLKVEHEKTRMTLREFIESRTPEEILLMQPIAENYCEDIVANTLFYHMLLTQCEESGIDPGIVSAYIALGVTIGQMYERKNPK